MSFIAKNPLTIPEVDNSPSIPQPGTRALFAGKDGWYDVDSSGNITKLGSNGESSGSGDKEIFTVYTESTIVGNGLSVSAATYDDILDAYNSGKIIRFAMEDGYVVYPLVQFDRSDNNLYFQYWENNTWYVYELQSEGISMQQIAYINAMDSERYDAEIGEMSELLTNASSVVDALNIHHNDIEALQTQMGDIATILADIKADQEALINGGEE